MIDASIHGYAVDTSKLKDVLDKALVEPLKKDRDERLADVAANDPQAHSLITDTRNNILSLSEQNIELPESREQLADAVTDRLLSYHESGQDVKESIWGIRSSRDLRASRAARKCCNGNEVLR